jgi:hypothetical protein
MATNRHVPHHMSGATHSTSAYPISAMYGPLKGTYAPWSLNSKKAAENPGSLHESVWFLTPSVMVLIGLLLLVIVGLRLRAEILSAITTIGGQMVEEMEAHQKKTLSGLTAVHEIPIAAAPARALSGHWVILAHTRVKHEHLLLATLSRATPSATCHGACPLTMRSSRVILPLKRRMSQTIPMINNTPPSLCHTHLLRIRPFLRRAQARVRTRTISLEYLWRKYVMV